MLLRTAVVQIPEAFAPDFIVAELDELEHEGIWQVIIGHKPPNRFVDDTVHLRVALFPHPISKHVNACGLHSVPQNTFENIIEAISHVASSFEIPGVPDFEFNVRAGITFYASRRIGGEYEIHAIVISQLYHVANSSGHFQNHIFVFQHRAEVIDEHNLFVWIRYYPQRSNLDISTNLISPLAGLDFTPSFLHPPELHDEWIRSLIRPTSQFWEARIFRLQYVVYHIDRNDFISCIGGAWVTLLVFLPMRGGLTPFLFRGRREGSWTMKAMFPRI